MRMASGPGPITGAYLDELEDSTFQEDPGDVVGRYRPCRRAALAGDSQGAMAIAGDFEDLPLCTDTMQRASLEHVDVKRLAVIITSASQQDASWHFEVTGPIPVLSTTGRGRRGRRR